MGPPLLPDKGPESSPLLSAFTAKRIPKKKGLANLSVLVKRSMSRMWQSMRQWSWQITLQRGSPPRTSHVSERSRDCFELSLGGRVISVFFHHCVLWPFCPLCPLLILSVSSYTEEEEEALAVSCVWHVLPLSQNVTISVIPHLHF